MTDLLATLLVWTLANTPYTASGQPQFLLTPTAKTEMTGGYEDGTDVIWITDVPGAESSNVRFRALVVHELTHWLQDQSGQYRDDTTCPAWQRREREAFDLQRLYLLQHGARPGPVPVLQCYP